MKIILFTLILFFLFSTSVQAQVVVSEVYPAPTSEENEWVELYNSSNENIDISDWKLFEHFADKNELIQFENLIINANSFFVFELPTNKLNNSEEKVSLENLNNEEVSSIYYKNSQSQKSFSYLFIDETTIGNTLELTNPSKNQINPQLAPSTPIPSSTPEVVPTSTPTIEPQTIVESNPKEITEINPFNPADMQSISSSQNKLLEQHKTINSKLEFPKIEINKKDGLKKRLPKFSYIIQKKISKEGFISAIIGGSLLLFTGLLL